MPQDGLEKMLDFLDDLNSRSIRYRVERQMPEAIMVTFVIGQTCVEVDFFEDEVWYSTFKNEGMSSNDEKILSALIDSVDG